MMRYKLYAINENTDKLIYEDDDFLKVAHKMLSCNEYDRYLLEYHSEMINETEYIYYPQKHTIVQMTYTSQIVMHEDAFIAYLETLDGGEG